MDEVRLARLVERLEAHLEGLRVAGEEGRKIAEERYKAFPEAGELFVVRMVGAGAKKLRVQELDLKKVRKFIYETIKKDIKPQSSSNS
jgi:hypothetical protein